MLHQVNATGRGCCAWHTTLNALLNTVIDFTGDDCKPAWRPSSSWQCLACLTLHPNAEHEEILTYCQVCDEERPPDAGPEHPASKNAGEISSCSADVEPLSSGGEADDSF